jgi:hypothetical protein
VADTTPTEPVTPTSALSLHDRVQQEQAQQEAQAKAEQAKTPATTAPRAETFHIEKGKILLLANGGVVKPEEVDALNDYVAFAADAQDDQQRLCEQWNRLMDKTGDWSKSDYSSFKSMISAEKQLLGRLNGMTAPTLYLEAHQARIRAAQLFVDGWQKIYSGDPGGTPTKDTTAVNQGLQSNRDGIEAWHSAQNMTVTATTLIKAGVETDAS